MSRTKRHDFWTSSAPKLFSTIPINLGTTLATLCMYQFTSTTRRRNATTVKQTMAYLEGKTSPDHLIKKWQQRRIVDASPSTQHGKAEWNPDRPTTHGKPRTHSAAARNDLAPKKQRVGFAPWRNEWSCIFSWPITRAPQDTMHYYFVTAGNNNTFFFQHAPPPRQTSGGPLNTF